jgi:hypothetical protein
MINRGKTALTFGRVATFAVFVESTVLTEFDRLGRCPDSPKTIWSEYLLPFRADL